MLGFPQPPPSAAADVWRILGPKFQSICFKDFAISIPKRNRPRDGGRNPLIANEMGETRKLSGIRRNRISPLVGGYVHKNYDPASEAKARLTVGVADQLVDFPSLTGLCKDNGRVP